MEYQKVCLEVYAKFLKEGGLRPVEFLWTDGVRYKIERVKFIENAPSRVSSILPVRYTVVIEGKEKYFYFEPEEMRWFVEVAV